MPKKLRKRQPHQGSRVKARGHEDAVNHDNSHPLFSLRHLRKNFCLSKCNTKEKAALADTLHKLSQCTWMSIKHMDRQGSGFEKIKRSAIRDGIPEIIKEDANIIGFRFYAKARMVGFRSREVFHIVWLDREYNLYAHGP